MTYFLCIAVSAKLLDMAKEFDERILIEDVSGLPVGKATLGGNARSSAFLVMMNGCSTDLLDAGARKRYSSRLFLDGVESILKRLPSVSILAHWFHGPISSETVMAAQKVPLTLGELKRIYPAIEQDVRYVITCPQRQPAVGGVGKRHARPDL